ncbi:hypothetical protein C7S16_5391 [Burkholderia thailandensis]|uniref:Uncharacterized protein n=1 Tax=Burkholderia thailandensis TaxID=57975 RepID=A0AAW9CNQ5_BURTH|nr:hypothetical protein [Burkholderia thailandensis]MDW9250783.1 hypothetical protein [Burkholderia thailandensis]
MRKRERRTNAPPPERCMRAQSAYRAQAAALHRRTIAHAAPASVLFGNMLVIKQAKSARQRLL